MAAPTAQQISGNHADGLGLGKTQVAAVSCPQHCSGETPVAHAADFHKLMALTALLHHQQQYPLTATCRSLVVVETALRLLSAYKAFYSKQAKTRSSGPRLALPAERPAGSRGVQIWKRTATAQSKGDSKHGSSQQAVGSRQRAASADNTVIMTSSPGLRTAASHSDSPAQGGTAEPPISQTHRKTGRTAPTARDGYTPPSLQLAFCPPSFAWLAA